MKIFIDANNFIVEEISKETCVCIHNKAQCDLDHVPFEMIETNRIGLTCIYAPTINLENGVIHPIYDVPNYKWINNTAVPITDPTDYQVNSTFWELYLKALDEQTYLWVQEKTNTELRDIYVNSPLYIQNSIFKSIQLYWSRKVPQWDVNLIFELLQRALLEKMYIETVEQRSLTQGESDTIENILQYIHNTNVMLKNNPDGEEPILDNNNWFMTYLYNMSGVCSEFRNSEYVQRMAVCFGVEV